VGELEADGETLSKFANMPLPLDNLSKLRTEELSNEEPAQSPVLDAERAAGTATTSAG